MDTRNKPRFSIDMTSDCELVGDNVKLSSGNKFQAKVFDISAGGMGAHIKHYLPKGAVMRISIGGEPFKLAEEIVVSGEVCYCRSSKPGEYKCGVKFLDLSDEKKKAIEQFVASFERRSNPRLNIE